MDILNDPDIQSTEYVLEYIKSLKHVKLWEEMMAVCYMPVNPRYSKFGANGYTVCDEWKSLSAFLEWSSDKPVDLSLSVLDGKEFSPESVVIGDKGRITTMYKSPDYVGKKYNLLTIVSLEKVPGKELMCVCRCECGNIKRARLQNVIRGLTKSCGCLLRNKTIKHGLARTKFYKMWSGKKNRGELCEEWMDFDGFKHWAESQGAILESDEDLVLVPNTPTKPKVYTPENCRLCVLKRFGVDEYRDKTVGKDSRTE